MGGVAFRRKLKSCKDKKTYIYGSLSILFISCLSLAGAVVIPCIKTKARDKWMQVFVALAVTTLLGDALMHLIPAALGVHNHGSGERRCERQSNGTNETLSEKDPSHHLLNHTHSSGHDHGTQKQHKFTDYTDYENHLEAEKEANENATSRSKVAHNQTDHNHSDRAANDSNQSKQSQSGNGNRTRTRLRRHAEYSYDEHEGHDHEGHEHEGHDGHERHDHEEHKGHEGHEGHNHGHHHGPEEKQYLIKLTAVFAAMFFFFCLERIPDGLNKARKEQKSKKLDSATDVPYISTRKRNQKVYDVNPYTYQYASLQSTDGYNQKQHGRITNGHDEQYHPYSLSAPYYPNMAAYVQSRRSNPAAYSIPPPIQAVTQFNNNDNAQFIGIYTANGGPEERYTNCPPSTAGAGPADNHEEVTKICGCTTLAFMILIGDAVHNFCDGLAVGATFAFSLNSGLSTSLAVACHELPHEIGDFAVLIDSGMSVCKALALNFLSALSAFAGLYVGIAFGSQDSARPWLFALAAGMFIYVALADMLVHMHGMGKNDKWWINFLLQSLGLFIGFVLIFLIGWFEHSIKV